jgi:hypothetical protein
LFASLGYVMDKLESSGETGKLAEAWCFSLHFKLPYLTFGRSVSWSKPTKVSSKCSERVSRNDFCFRYICIN